MINLKKYNIDMYNKRHSLSHLLAIAALEYDKNAKLGIGPVIDNGFYYDILFKKKISDSNIEDFEKRMRELIKENLPFKKEEISYEEAKELFKYQPFKLELIEGLKDEKITIERTGDIFVDLCEGGHVDKTGEINPEGFKLTSIAGAYWKGKNENAMLTRIYGLAFDTKEELDVHIEAMEEAKKRDHRVLGEKLKLFMISDVVGKGLPIYLPDGAFIRKKLEEYIYEKETERGYKYINTPILTHKRLYEKSGHLDHYSDDMYSPIDIEGEEYYLRPMNCPHHHQVFCNGIVSYRDLPIKLAEAGLVHRFERSGVLTGIIRSRCFTQNDAHIYCEKKDLEKEIMEVLELFKEVYEDFEITDYWYRLSLPDFDNKEKFGDIEKKEIWEESSEITRKALEKFGAKYVEGVGEAAFYGPKIDVQIKNVNGKEDTIATIQVDFYSPDRFNLSFINNEGKKERPVIIHRAILGSFERFLAFLIEQHAGAFPFWLSPKQIDIIPVSDKFLDYAEEIKKQLKGYRVEINTSRDTLGKKIRSAKENKTPYYLILGETEKTDNTIKVEGRDGFSETMRVDEFIDKLSKYSSH